MILCWFVYSFFFKVYLCIVLLVIILDIRIHVRNLSSDTTLLPFGYLYPYLALNIIVSGVPSTYIVHHFRGYNDFSPVRIFFFSWSSKLFSIASFSLSRSPFNHFLMVGLPAQVIFTGFPSLEGVFLSSFISEGYCCQMENHSSQFFSLSIWKMYHFLMATMVSDEKSTFI